MGVDPRENFRTPRTVRALVGVAVTATLAPAIQLPTVATTLRATAAAFMPFVFHFIKVGLSSGSDKLELIES